MVTIVILSYLISIAGVNQIIVLAEPILNTFYPTTIVLILLNLFRSKIKNENIFRGAVYGATFAGFVFAVSKLLPEGNAVANIVQKLPLGSDGFMWIYFAIVGAIIGMLIKKK